VNFPSINVTEDISTDTETSKCSTLKCVSKTVQNVTFMYNYTFNKLQYRNVKVKIKSLCLTKYHAMKIYTVLN
jgi:hypothetical protein